MIFNLNRIKLFFRIIMPLDNFISKIVYKLKLSPKNNRKNSIREKFHLRPNKVFTDGNTEVIRLGFYSHNIMRNLELLKLKKASKDFKSPILDIGCGNGLFASLFLDHVDVGLDLDYRNIELAKKYKIYDEIKSADCTKDIPYSKNYFNTIFSNSVVEHIPDIEGLVKNCSKVLNPNGKLYFTTYSNEFTNCLSKNLGKKVAKQYNKSLTHVSLLPPSEWEEIFDRHKLKINRIEYYLNCEALIEMRFYSSNIFHLIEVLFGDLFWRIYRSRLINIVQESENLSSGIGMLIVAEKTSIN
tara:strand:+ start:217 stop:1113 length:897 start_codon:yes stop_codon:yes gene_type:complete